MPFDTASFYQIKIKNSIMNNFNRRNFIKTSLMGSTAAFTLGNSTFNGLAFSQSVDIQKPSVSLVKGEDRADMVFRALQPYAKQIKRAIGNRRVVLKPNNVLIYVPLACTHVETLEGILEFLKSIGKLKNTVIAESSASGSTREGFDNYGYFRLSSKYPVKLVDLDNEPSELMHVISEKSFRPQKVKVASMILDPDSYVVSVARMKTHNTVGATLSLKNIVIGAPVKDPGFTLYNEDLRFSRLAKQSKEGTVSYKIFLHGDGMHAVNYNFAILAQSLHPDLAIIDGHTGMEGNGPTQGTPIDHRVCLVSQDWMAADRIGIELMGMNFSEIGYLNHCAQMGMGTSDLSRIEIIGARLKDCIKQYKLPDNYQRQLVWMNPKS
jgi:uncharacterized protein (DUF362 family)